MLYGQKFVEYKLMACPNLNQVHFTMMQPKSGMSPLVYQKQQNDPHCQEIDQSISNIAV